MFSYIIFNFPRNISFCIVFIIHYALKLHLKQPYFYLQFMNIKFFVYIIFFVIFMYLTKTFNKVCLLGHIYPNTKFSIHPIVVMQ